MTPVLDRFWSKVDISAGANGCWPWTAARTPFGHGVFHPAHGETTRAHRYALVLHLGRPLAPNAEACHTCDNPPCVNPAHLYEGTRQTNVADCVDRGRQKRGMDDPGAKLTDEQVLAIRLAAATGAPLFVLAAKYGVTPGLVSGIVRGNRWQHVSGPITKRYRKGQ